MTDVVEQARTSIEGRLREIEAEATRLRKALAGLGNGKVTRRRVSRSANGRPSASDSRAGRGQRQVEFLEVLKTSPGAKVPDIAKQIGVSPNQAYGLARKLHETGQIVKRRGGGYAAKA